MIQAERQKPMACYNFGKERIEQTKKTPWSKKTSNKENIINEQMHTPQSKAREPEISNAGFTSLMNGFNHRSKSPLSSRSTIDNQNQ
jgi:hypothetical protein